MTVALGLVGLLIGGTAALFALLLIVAHIYALIDDVRDARERRGSRDEREARLYLFPTGDVRGTQRNPPIDGGRAA